MFVCVYGLIGSEVLTVRRHMSCCGSFICIVVSMTLYLYLSLRLCVRVCLRMCQSVPMSVRTAEKNCLVAKRS